MCLNKTETQTRTALSEEKIEYSEKTSENSDKKKKVKRSKRLPNTDPESTAFHLTLKHNIYPHFVSHSNQEIKTRIMVFRILFDTYFKSQNYFPSIKPFTSISNSLYSLQI